MAQRDVTVYATVGMHTGLGVVQWVTRHHAPIDVMPMAPDSAAHDISSSTELSRAMAYYVYVSGARWRQREDAALYTPCASGAVSPSCGCHNKGARGGAPSGARAATLSLWASSLRMCAGSHIGSNWRSC